MKENINKEKNGTTNIIFEYTPEEVNDIRRNAFNDIRKNLRIDGFRKGKISFKMAQKLFGKGFLDNEIIDSSVNKDFSKLLDEKDIIPLSQPNIKSFDYTGDDGLKVNIEFASAPDFEIPQERSESVIENLNDLSKEAISEDLEDENIFTLFNYLVKTPVDREIQENDLVELEVLDTNSRKAIPKEIGIIIGKDNLYFEPELTKKLIGKNKGKLARIKDGNLFYDFKIKDIYEYELPEITEEFVKENFDFDSVDDFKKYINEVNSSSKLIRLTNQNGNELLKDVLDNTELEVSPLYIERLKEDYKDYLDELPKLDSTFSPDASIDENLKTLAKEQFILNNIIDTYNVDMENKFTQYSLFNIGTQYEDYVTQKKVNKLVDLLFFMSLQELEVGNVLNYLNIMNDLMKKEPNA